MKGEGNVEQVESQYGDYLNEVIYMPVVKLDKEGAEEQIKKFMDSMNPRAFEFVYSNDSNPLPKNLKVMLSGRSLIWYNTLWADLVAGHDDNASKKDFNNGYGYVIDVLGTRIIQTDNPPFLLDYLRSRKLHD